MLPLSKPAIFFFSVQQKPITSNKKDNLIYLDQQKNQVFELKL